MQGRLLPFDELSARITARTDCTRLTLLNYGELENRDGTPASAVYAFVRAIQGEEDRSVVVTVYDDRQPFTTMAVDHICRRLGLEPEDLTGPA